jgi:hypothetical protein
MGGLLAVDRARNKRTAEQACRRRDGRILGRGCESPRLHFPQRARAALRGASPFLLPGAFRRITPCSPPPRLCPKTPAHRHTAPAASVVSRPRIAPETCVPPPRNLPGPFAPRAAALEAPPTPRRFPVRGNRSLRRRLFTAIFHPVPRVKDGVTPLCTAAPPVSGTQRHHYTQ